MENDTYKDEEIKKIIENIKLLENKKDIITFLCSFFAAQD